MAPTYHRRLRMLRPAANDPTPHQQNWSDLHQQAHDQMEAARGIFYGLCLAGGLWLMVFIGVFAAVWILG